MCSYFMKYRYTKRINNLLEMLTVVCGSPTLKRFLTLELKLAPLLLVANASIDFTHEYLIRCHPTI